MGSPLGPGLAIIFIGYYKEKLFSQTQKTQTYFRYVDNTFAIFDHEAEEDEFLTQLNCLYPSLGFIFEKEEKNFYRFLMFTSKEQMLALRQCISETHFHWPVFALGVL